jgi:hypothetical protein
MKDSTLEQLITAARLLHPLLGELVFVGGTVTGRLITDEAAADLPFPAVADEVGPLTPEVEPVVTILSMVPLAKFVASSRGHVGHPRCDRQRSATALIAKAC